ncbi:allantoinase PuuE [Halioxenophilus sp. WMMB6]|uniref:allantoinase PuuE n=1 Tax=Halioxenophilus sp. WMMB6 TaxID=3073815 RepID=UPI00295ED070|nr:allantoinase PuuE [Halioxenophilus sp. WMMB6]
MSFYPRDLIGYGATTPAPNWPNNARVALQFVINYEEGGENCILDGDPASERFLSEIIGAEAFAGQRHMSMESIYEYGSRAGFWRLYRLFTERQLPVTVFGVGQALAKNPAAVEAMLKADWEIACHGLKWTHYQDMAIEQEREMMAQAIELHTQVTGSRPLGWYTGRDSPNTRLLVAEYGGFAYHSDSYGDDLPYWCYDFEEPLLTVPYTLDSNDMRFATPQGFNAGDQFFNYLKDSFDFLYEEGKTAPKMLNIGLHCRLVGRPGRAMALKRFLDYVQQHSQVWVATRLDIARHWQAVHPPISA